MLCKSFLSQFLPFCARFAIVGIGPNAYTATWREDTCNLNVFRIHKLDKVLHDDVDAVFVEVAVVAEAEEIQLQTLALHHLNVGHVADTYFGKVGLSGDRAE